MENGGMTKSRGILDPFRRWTQIDLEKLTLWYPNVSTVEIADRLGFSLSRVYCKAHKLGLKKSADYMVKQLEKSGEEIARLGGDTRFKPGLTPCLLFREILEFDVTEHGPSLECVRCPGCLNVYPRGE